MLYKRDKDNKMQAYIGKKQYLQDIKNRLEDDVEPYLKLIWELNSVNENKNVGFWGLARTILPVVDTLGYILYPEEKESWFAAAKVLKSINVPYPFISWKIFRDCLIHGDELVSVIDDEMELYSGWEISIGGGHTTKPTSPHIDIEQLYHDLMKYMDRLIEESDNKDEVVIKAIRFSQKQFDKSPELKEEYEFLFSELNKLKSSTK